MLKRFRFAALALAAILPSLAAAQPQPWPSHTVKMLVGFAPGGGTDVVARLIAQKLQESLGQPFVVENRPGATGTIAADVVAKSAPDGYTILMGHVNSNAIAPNLFKSLPYDAVADFQPVTYVGYVPNILAVNPNVPVKNVAELIAAAKAEPNKFSYASSGVGSTQHLAGEMFQLLTGTKLVHIPYKGSGQAITDLLSGQVALNFDTMPPVLPHIQAGKLKAFAISTPQRLPQLPDVPTFVEVGITGFDVTNWYGVFVPARTPKEIVNRLSVEINKAMQDPSTRTKLVDIGTQLGGGTPQDFEVFLKSELAKYAKLVKEAKVSID
jgi:tripartite-type tricarboxylate transporter receptor subunit TctC